MSNVEQTLAERGSRYGHFGDNAQTSQELERILFSGATAHKLTHTHREGLKFITQKLSRIVNGDANYEDNWHDIAGYATLVEIECKKANGREQK